MFLTGFHDSQKLTLSMSYIEKTILGSEDYVFIIGIISIKEIFQPYTLL